MQRIDTNMMQAPQPRLRFEAGYRYSRVDCSVCGTEIGQGTCTHTAGDTLPDGTQIAGIIRDPKLESVSLVSAENPHAQK
jgi:hypothetical protein